MKNIIIIALSVILFFSSCHVEKRKYRSGFYLLNHKNQTGNSSISKNAVYKTNDILLEEIPHNETCMNTDTAIINESFSFEISKIQIPEKNKLLPKNNIRNNFNNQYKYNNKTPIVKKVIKHDNISKDKRNDKYYITRGWLYLSISAVFTNLALFYSITGSNIWVILSCLYLSILFYVLFIIKQIEIKKNQGKKSHRLSYISLLLLIISPLGFMFFSFSLIPIVNSLPVLLLSLILSVISVLYTNKEKEKYKWGIALKTALVFSITMVLTLFFRFYMFY